MEQYLEILDLVDENNQVIGAAPRAKVRRENLLHRGVGILCWNSSGQLYVHQRTDSKDLFPSYFDVMVGGAVSSGEDYDIAAQREVEEELGMTGVQPTYLLDYLYHGPENYSWIKLYEVTYDGPIIWQASEVCWGTWMDFQQVLSWMEETAIVPDGLELFQHYLKTR